MKEIDLSTVIPVKNEEEALPVLYSHLKGSFERMGRSYEVILVNDGSEDNSLEVMKQLRRKDTNFKILSLSRSFGHQIAISAGMEFSRGRAVIIMDADMQDPPAMIPIFVNKWEKGFRVVYGIRRRRKEGVFKKVLYKTFYRILRKIADIDIPLDAGDFCLMDREVVDLINSMPERNRFLRGIRSWVGFKQIGIEYERGKRQGGRAKYNFFSLLKLAMDGIVSFSSFPLKMAIWIGFFISIASIAYSLRLILNRFLNPDNQIPGWTSIAAGITFLGGLQLMIMGFLGEYISRIFDEVKGRPHFILNEVIGFEDEKAKG